MYSGLYRVNCQARKTSRDGYLCER